MRSDYTERFGQANPDRFDNPARAVKILFNANTGWLDPEEDRLADWQEREKPKPLVEKKPDYLAMQSLLDAPPAQRRPPVRIVAGNGRPKLPKKPTPPKISASQALERRLAGESVVSISRAEKCTTHAIYKLLEVAGYTQERTCQTCAVNISDLHFKAFRCRPCQMEQKKFRQTQAYRKSREPQQSTETPES